MVLKCWTRRILLYEVVRKTFFMLSNDFCYLIESWCFFMFYMKVMFLFILLLKLLI